jgi:hypothetical protein
MLLYENVRDYSIFAGALHEFGDLRAALSLSTGMSDLQNEIIQSEEVVINLQLVA